MPVKGGVGFPGAMEVEGGGGGWWEFTSGLAARWHLTQREKRSGEVGSDWGLVIKKEINMGLNMDRTIDLMNG